MCLTVLYNIFIFTSYKQNKKQQTTAHKYHTHYSFCHVEALSNK